MIRHLIADDAVTTPALVLAYFTGLRPSEVVRIRPEDIDHIALTLRVVETKTRKGERWIAIPKTLSSWAREHEWKEISMNAIHHRLATLKKEHPALAHLCMATFRKNFAAVMEEAGATHEQIDSHQGRGQ